jgi:hypothetical protein
MAAKLQVTIPTPCHEDWNKMTPAEKGRFCGSCQKVVMDFTSMSDAQIIAYFKRPAENTCGRFYNDQLYRDMVPAKKRLPWIKYFFQIAVPALLFSSRAASQGKPVKGETVSIIRTLEGRVGKVALSDERPQAKDPESYHVRGRVTDAKGEGVPFATVAVNNTSNAVQADVHGKFIIEVKDPNGKLLVSAAGYVSQVVSVNSRRTVPVNLMASGDQIYGDVVITVGIVSPYEEKWPFFSSRGLNGALFGEKASYMASGTVLDEDGQPLAAASVLLENSGIGTTTDKEGGFELRPRTKRYTLVVSMVGYRTVTKKVKGTFIEDIVLQRLHQNLDTVVVCAEEGIVKKQMSTGLTSIVTTSKTSSVPFWERILGSKQSFTVYPNPVSSASTITVEWKQEQGGYDWGLTDVAGRIVTKGRIVVSDQIRYFTISLPAAPPGTYILTFLGKKGKAYSEKIIIGH